MRRIARKTDNATSDQPSVEEPARAAKLVTPSRGIVTPFFTKSSWHTHGISCLACGRTWMKANKRTIKEFDWNTLQELYTALKTAKAQQTAMGLISKKEAKNFAKRAKNFCGQVKVAITNGCHLRGDDSVAEHTGRRAELGRAPSNGSIPLQPLVSADMTVEEPITDCLPPPSPHPLSPSASEAVSAPTQPTQPRPINVTGNEHECDTSAPVGFDSQIQTVPSPVIPVNEDSPEVHVPESSKSAARQRDRCNCWLAVMPKQTALLPLGAEYCGAYLIDSDEGPESAPQSGVVLEITNGNDSRLNVQARAELRTSDGQQIAGPDLSVGISVGPRTVARFCMEPGQPAALETSSISCAADLRDPDNPQLLYVHNALRHLVTLQIAHSFGAPQRRHRRPSGPASIPVEEIRTDEDIGSSAAVASTGTMHLQPSSSNVPPSANRQSLSCNGNVNAPSSAAEGSSSRARPTSTGEGISRASSTTLVGTSRDSSLSTHSSNHTTSYYGEFQARKHSSALASTPDAENSSMRMQAELRVPDPAGTHVVEPVACHERSTMGSASNRATANNGAIFCSQLSHSPAEDDIIPTGSTNRRLQQDLDRSGSTPSRYSQMSLLYVEPGARPIFDRRRTQPRVSYGQIGRYEAHPMSTESSSRSHANQRQEFGYIWDVVQAMQQPTGEVTTPETYREIPSGFALPPSQYTWTRAERSRAEVFSQAGNNLGRTITSAHSGRPFLIHSEADPIVTSAAAIRGRTICRPAAGIQQTDSAINPEPANQEAERCGGSGIAIAMPQPLRAINIQALQEAVQELEAQARKSDDLDFMCPDSDIVEPSYSVRRDPSVPSYIGDGPMQTDYMQSGEATDNAVPYARGSSIAKLQGRNAKLAAQHLASIGERPPQANQVEFAHTHGQESLRTGGITQTLPAGLLDTERQSEGLDQCDWAARSFHVVRNAVGELEGYFAYDGRKLHVPDGWARNPYPTPSNNGRTPSADSLPKQPKGKQPIRGAAFNPWSRAPASPGPHQ